MLLHCSMPIVVEYGRWNQKTYDLVPKSLDLPLKSHRVTIQKSWTYHSKVIELPFKSHRLTTQKS